MQTGQVWKYMSFLSLVQLEEMTSMPPKKQHGWFSVGRQTSHCSLNVSPGMQFNIPERSQKAVGSVKRVARWT